MVEVCDSIGSEFCLKVHYEKLVLRPTSEMTRILGWLGVSFDDIVLHHEQTIGRPSGAKISGYY